MLLKECGNGLQSYPNWSVLSYVPGDQQFEQSASTTKYLCKMIFKNMIFFNITANEKLVQNLYVWNKMIYIYSPFFF
jgi:hypothetical protein